ncbi:hypothetical protein LIS83_25530 [Bacillus anthracis]|uniref:hypothetical protein n=1 Tax=Bacillus anthracis TaxID=1392 RepID=UPI00207AA053|nr:hypothetical protein [Bacillus anthracis]USL02182.1 hypothetical protein LIS83_25530 [Bacillus anthracis]
MKKLKSLLNKEERMDVLLPLCEDISDNGYYVLDKENQPKVMVLDGLIFKPYQSINEIVYETLNGEKRVIKVVYSYDMELKEILVSLPNVDTNVEYPVHQYVPPQHFIESARNRKKMNPILNALQIEIKMNYEIEDDLSEHKQNMVSNKNMLRYVIEIGCITNEKKAKKYIQLIELMYEWSVDNPHNVEHKLMFVGETIELQSNGQGRSGKWIVDYKDDELYLNGEKFDGSIPNLLNFIEAELLIHHV